jgi:ferredoxin
VRLVADLDRCAGHGRCYDLAPDLIEPDTDGFALLTVTGELTPEQQRSADTAVRNCPERALSLTV